MPLRELTTNRLHPSAQCSFPPTHVGGDSQFLRHCEVSVHVSFSPLDVTVNQSLVEGEPMVLSMLREHQGFKHGQSLRLSSPTGERGAGAAGAR